ncbi:hypothetical protein [Nevskia sp.]|uniref:hypothetical protein n=1 Tax=Nevskia sp. TaxID=1929292 RepID=UPI0025DCC2C9|nr:hypothetical protein [Nevskia sp.]
MNATVIWVLLLVVVLIVGPFATLRAVSHYKARRLSSTKKPAADDDNPDDPDKPRGFW